jgi:serine/threonine protein kinase
MTTCSNCSAQIRETAKYCHKCGKSIAVFIWDAPTLIMKNNAAGVLCERCKTFNLPGTGFCSGCNLRLVSFRSLVAGDHIGNYQVIRQLGVGGIGAVYLAEHYRLRYQVAIKVHDYFPEDAQVGRAFEEASNYLSQLRHPYIIQFHDYGFQSGHAYQAMEYIDGPTFASVIPNSQSERWLDQCLAYFSQLFSALHYAHNCRFRDINGVLRQSIIHGDVKPQNIFLDRSTNSVKLADFMIPDVQAFLGRENNERLNINTDAFGTPGYMAPEQQAGSLNSQTDIYSLGVTMYEMVTSRMFSPRLRDTGMKLHDQYLPSRLNAYVPLWLEQMIVKAMSFFPRERFQTVAEMIRMLDEHGKAEVLSSGGVIMGDQINIQAGSISGGSGQMFLGKTKIDTNTIGAGQDELARALGELTKALLASQHLSDEEKQEQVEIINDIEENAAQPKPNKSRLKALANGLLLGLKAVPDVASAIAAAAPLLTKLHM